MPVERRDPGARIKNKKRRICILYRALRLQLHLGFDLRLRRFLEPGSIHRRKTQFSQHRITFTAITRNPRGRIDERRTATDQAVKKR